MKCPLCDVELTMTERQGIEVDYCTKCRGVWLDRGELDKIIERAAGDDGSSPAAQPRTGYGHAGRDEYHDRRYRDERHDHRHRRRKSFLGELFDFD